MNLFTELDSRKLWFDGTNQINADDVPKFLMAGCSISDLAVNELTDEVRQFNLLSDETLSADKSENKPFNFEWDIPSKYKNLDLVAYLNAKLENKSEEYHSRVAEELVHINSRNISMLFRTIIYLVDELRDRSKVWGVGRGSSCACLILYLIGLHQVDPIKYNIPISEFFHD